MLAWIYYFLVAFTASSMLTGALYSGALNAVDKLYGGEQVVGSKKPKRIKVMYAVIGLSGVIALGTGHYIWGGVIIGEFCLLVAFWKSVFYGRF